MVEYVSCPDRENETLVLRCGAVETIVDVLDAVALVHPEREAYVFGDDRVTFRELQRRSAGFASTLRDLGVANGDVVSLQIPSSIDFAICYLGAARAGAITSAINGRLGERERVSIVERTQPKVSVMLADACEAAPTPDRAIMANVYDSFDII